ncbi:Aspartic protease [Hypsizygus marmoreus]|uniref:Aspartic protease n=1 Tax=Hypsizygus marmoreus TaxID=39966 RepID=A0A369JWX3_HYPMA|nr:Aspartic protease [Hypsizygus marmoreus]
MWSLSTLLLLPASLVLLVSAESWSPRLVQRSDAITLPIHRHFSRGDAVNGTARSGLTPVTISTDRQSYFAVIDVAEISFRVALDTASADLWVVSSDCNTKTCTKVPRYPRSYQSPTYVTVNGNSTPFHASYIDGTVASGFVAKETVRFSNLTVANQAFGLVTDSNVTMVDETSGIIGLGFPRLSSISPSVTNSTPFFVTLAQQGLLDYPVFGLSLTRNTSGTLSIGAVDSSVVTNLSLISWNRVVDFTPFGSESNVSSYLQWVIPISRFSVNGTQFTPIPTYPNNTSNASLALFDIGSPGIYGPYRDVSRLFALIDGARIVDSSGQWAIPCDTVVPISLTFGSRNYTLQPSDYIIGPASGNPNLCLAWPRASPPSADAIDWQIGTAFLRTVYSIYSYGINRKEPPLIGLYPLHNGTQPPETPDYVASVLSSLSATVATTLPNFLLPTPTYTTPAYAFNTSISHATKGIVTSGLATSTYRPILGNQNIFNATALPAITPSPTLATFLLTNSAGLVVTSVSTFTPPEVTLGVPPGWNGAPSSLHATFMAVILPALLVSWTLIYSTDIL